MGQKVPKEGEGIVSENGRRTGLAGHPRSFETVLSCTSISVSLSCCVPLTWGGVGGGARGACLVSFRSFVSRKGGSPEDMAGATPVSAGLT